MNRPSLLRIAFTMAGVFCASVFAAPQDPSTKPQRITEEHRVTLIRELQAEHAFTKIAFPQGKKGVIIKDGKMSPGEMEVSRLVMKEGAAANVGDRVLITNLIFLGDKLVFELNGGPRKGTKWYQRISVSAGGGDVPIAPTDGRAQVSQGSVVTLVFHDYIPDVSPDEVKHLLSSVLDFTAMTVAEAYAKALPPKVQEAIKNHKVLVGMDRDMVQYSLGRPPKRYRDKDEKGRDYEEWIYGVPPQEVQFVRFIGPTVAQLTVMQVSGEKVVKTEPEVELAAKESQPKPEDDAGPVKKKAKRPTLLAPGETGPDGKPVPDPKAPDGSSPDATSTPHFSSNAP